MSAAYKFLALSAQAERTGNLQEAHRTRVLAAEYFADERLHRHAAANYRHAAALLDRRADAQDALGDAAEKGSEGGPNRGKNRD
jgi:hypothetical protein